MRMRYSVIILLLPFYFFLWNVSAKEVKDVKVDLTEEKVAKTDSVKMDIKKEPKEKEDKKDLPKKDKEEDEELEGFDTISIKEPEGNWLLKRWWWSKAQKKYEKIKRMVSGIIDSRMYFFEKENEIDKDVFDPFYLSLGLDQGEIQVVINDLLAMIRKGEENEEDLLKSEKEFLETLKKEKIKLEQIKAKVEAVKKLDDAIGVDLTTLMQQINASRRYEEMAWQMFKDIAKELNHQKAREIYRQMDSLWQNVKNINSYIRGEFTNHFNNIIEQAKDVTDKIKKEASELKAKGIDLKQQYKKLEEGIKKTAVIIPEKPKKEIPQEEIEEEEIGWLGTIWNVITWPIRKIWGALNSLWS